VWPVLDLLVTSSSVTWGANASRRAALVTGSRPGLGAAAGLAALYDLRARDEERGLAARYPAYAAYARRSRRFLPLVY
jgi:protein-S-isoprenylcysteine O-methyltransferase Ste14